MKTGSARTEGYYKITQEIKDTYLEVRIVYQLSSITSSLSTSLNTSLFIFPTNSLQSPHLSQHLSIQVSLSFQPTLFNHLTSLNISQYKSLYLSNQLSSITSPLSTSLNTNLFIFPTNSLQSPHVSQHNIGD